jgi:hypothetical protein
MVDLPINEIGFDLLERTRSYTPEATDKLADSFQAVGQLQPIIVRPKIDGKYKLVAGLHRLIAAETCNWKTIRAEITILESDIDLGLAEIDENLFRTELTAVQLATLVPRRKELFELKYPEATALAQRKAAGPKGGRPSKSGKPSKPKTENLFLVSEPAKSFVDDTAEKTGKTSETVRVSVRRGKVPNIAKLENTPLDKGTVLDAFADIDAPAQKLRDAAKLAADKGNTAKAEKLTAAAEEAGAKTQELITQAALEPQKAAEEAGAKVQEQLAKAGPEEAAKVIAAAVASPSKKEKLIKAAKTNPKAAVEATVRQVKEEASAKKAAEVAEKIKGEAAKTRAKKPRKPVVKDEDLTPAQIRRDERIHRIRGQLNHIGSAIESINYDGLVKVSDMLLDLVRAVTLAERLG